MKRFLRASGILVALAVLVVLGLRFVPHPPWRTDAMRVLAAPTPPVAGRDATDFVWLLGHDVPADKRAEVGAAHRRWQDERERLRREHRRDLADRLPDPLAKWPALVDAPADAPGLCASNEPDRCLATVRADPAASAALLARHAGQLQVARQLRDHDGVRWGIESGAGQPWPKLGTGRALLVTAIAERFVRGEHDAAIAEACGEVAGMRRLGADSDQLVLSIGATGYARQSLQLLASLLAERPATLPLPAGCDAALAEATDAEFDMCPEMKGEWEQVRHVLGPATDATGAARWDSRLMTMTLDHDFIVASMAHQFARLCGPAVVANARADRSARALPSRDLSCRKVEWVARPTDCLIMEIAPSRFDDYIDRRTDLAAEVALMRTWLWLRAQDPDPVAWPALVPKRPAALGLRREPRVDLARGVLEIDLLKRTDGPYALVLPADPVAP